MLLLPSHRILFSVRLPSATFSTPSDVDVVVLCCVVLVVDIEVDKVANKLDDMLVDM